MISLLVRAAPVKTRGARTTSNWIRGSRSANEKPRYKQPVWPWHCKCYHTHASRGTFEARATVLCLSVKSYPVLAIVQLSSVKMKEGDLEVGTGTETVSSVTFLRTMILMRHPITQLSFSRMKVEAAAGSGGRLSRMQSEVSLEPATGRRAEG